MSKLYDRYLELKKENENILYLFKSGIFFIALNDDAAKLSDIFGFKITNLNDSVLKCGFPSKRIEYYSQLLEKMNVDFKIIDQTSNVVKSQSEFINTVKFQNIINKLSKIDFDNITFKEAFEVLYKLSNETKEILKKQ